MNHSFNIEHARLYGLVEAVLIHNLQFWVARNRANDEHFHDGRTWSYNSVKAFGRLFPYLTSKQIRGGLERLEEKGVLVVGRYSDDPRDRTKWYAFSDEERFVSVEMGDLPSGANGIAGGGESDLPAAANARARRGKSLITTDGKHADGKPDAVARPARGTRLPKDWLLPRAWGLWALSDPDVNAGGQWTEAHVRATANRFRDYWTAKPGQAGVKLDWLATWRNWCRDPKSSPGTGAGGVTKTEARSAHNKNAVSEAVRLRQQRRGAVDGSAGETNAH